ncbi:hypothetical protein LMG33818_001819 [Halomonadaceae bacterium LMG 33818]
MLLTGKIATQYIRIRLSSKLGNLKRRFARHITPHTYATQTYRDISQRESASRHSLPSSSGLE